MTARVAVIGAGAAGTMVAVRLRALGVPVCLLDPRRETGRGVAYGTTNDRHLLNVVAGKLSARDDDPDDFTRWATVRLGRTVAPTEFLPRKVFGAYLGALAAGADVERRYDRVVGMAVIPSGVRLTLSSGEEMDARAAVLATGVLPPSIGWAPTTLRTSPRFVPDPWSWPGEAASGDVLLVGTGLTMVDLAITMGRPGRTIHAVSRHGLLPRSHRPGAAPVVPPELPGTLAGLRHELAAHLSHVMRTTGDWRAAIDGLRPLTAGLWQRLSMADRARFLAEDLRHWEVRRHRIPPAVANEIRHLRRSGRLRVHTASVAAAEEGPAGLRVTLSSGTELAVTTVINCTGPQCDPTHVDDPLTRDLLATGLAHRDPLGLGFATSEDGRLTEHAPLWTIGSLRRGALWETTAFPEIKAQAGQVAAEIGSTVRLAAVA